MLLASCGLAHCLHVASRAPAPRCLATGDRVRVVSDVVSKGVATLGMRGTVLDAWEPDAENWGLCCELDPACAASVTVRLDPPLGYYEVNEVQRIDGSRTGDLVEGEGVIDEGVERDKVERQVVPLRPLHQRVEAHNEALAALEAKAFHPGEAAVTEALELAGSAELLQHVTLLLRARLLALLSRPAG